MFSSNRRAIGAAMFACVAMLAASPVSAQSDGYPAKRIRPLHIYENCSNAPQNTITEARVVVRKFALESGNGAMRITGEVWTDFEVESGHNVPSGQLMGVEIEVTLHMQSSDLDDNIGEMVPGQRVMCKTSTTEEGPGVTLGLAKFELPDMARPLPPGIYRLRCRAMAATQQKPIKDALKWVSTMYGVWVDYDENGAEVKRQPVYENAAILEKVYKEQIADCEVFESKGTLFLGNLVRGNSVVLDAKSFLCRNAHFEILVELERLEGQRKVVKDAWEFDSKNTDLPKEVRAKKKVDFDRDIGLIDALEKKGGGKRDPKELSFYGATQASMAAILDQIILWEDDLTLKYWHLIDGVLNYGWHSVNNPGYNMYKAVDSNNNTADREARVKKLDDLEKTDGAKATRDTKREDAWKFIPASIKKIAFEYLSRKEEKPDFDADRFTKKEGKNVIVDPVKWAAYRATFLAKFKKDVKVALDAVDVSRIYSIQKWGSIFDKCIEMRDAVITHTYCYERCARILTVEKAFEKDAAAKAEAVEIAGKTIIEEWEASLEGEELKEMRPYFNRAKTAPSSVASTFDTAQKVAKKDIDIKDFAYRYAFTVNKQPAPPPRRYSKK